MSRKFNIILFTASEKSYADKILDKIDREGKFFFLKLYRHNCVFTQMGIVMKNIGIFSNIDTKNTIYIDNSHFHFFTHLKHGIPIIPFNGEKNDTELLKLGRFLKELIKQKDMVSFLDKIFKLGLTI